MIGIFDSGIGGLTVLKALREKLPEYSFVYFGDTARAPYGGKSEEAIKRFGHEDAELLLRHGAKIIIIACNTVSAVAAHELRQELPVPVFDVVTPAVRQALERTKGNIGVIGTRATIACGIYQKLLLSQDKIVVHAEACPLFVPLVEEGWEDTPEARHIVKRSLAPLKLKSIDTLILGCTHYPLLTELITDAIGDGVELVDSSIAVAHEASLFLKGHKEVEAALDKRGEVRIITSDITPHLTALTARWFGNVSMEVANA